MKTQNFINSLDQTHIFILLPFFIGILISLFACTASEKSSGEQKFTPALKEKIRSVEKNNPDAIIQVLIKISEKLNDKMQREIETTGIVLESLAGLVITASGRTDQLKSAAELSFIISLELSQIRDHYK